MNLAASSSVRVQRVGFALAAIGLASPFIASGLGQIGSTAVSSQFTRALLLLVTFVAFAWLVTRPLSKAARANAQMAAALALCLFMTDGLVQVSREEKEIDQYLRNVMAFQHVQAGRYAALGKRFEELRLDLALSPSRLATATGREEGASIVKRYRDLVTERHTLLDSHAAEVERMVGTLTTDEAKRMALDSANESLRPARRLYDQLGQAQYAMADDMDAIIAWYSSQAASERTRGGTVRSTATEAKPTMDALLGALNRSRVRVLTTTVELAAFHARKGSKAARLNASLKVAN